MTKNTWTRELALKTPVRSRGEKTGNLIFTFTKKNLIRERINYF